MADTLSCGYVLDLAKKRLSDIWDGRTPPTVDGSDAEDRSIDSAVRVIEVGRKYGMPGVLKRGFYEILSSESFGEMLESVASRESAISKLSIPEEDVRRLLAGRLKIGRLWREFVLESPSGAWRVSNQDPSSTYRCCHARDSKEARAGKWRNLVCERGLLEVDDPICFDLVKKLRNVGEGEEWCHGCMDSKKRAWEEKRAEWWNAMDAWFSL